MKEFRANTIKLQACSATANDLFEWDLLEFHMIKTVCPALKMSARVRAERLSGPFYEQTVGKNRRVLCVAG